MAQKLEQTPNESTETATGKPISKIIFLKQRFGLHISLIIAIIILLWVIILLSNAFNINRTNNSNENNNQFKSTVEQPQIPGSRHRLIYRDRWGGRPALYEHPQKVPVNYVIISHTAGAECFDITACSKQMLQIQSLHVDSGSSDVGYNFVIGGDANIYVARGWDIHNFHMNLDTIGICFIGNYVYNKLTPAMMEATQKLLKMGVEKGKLDKNYILVAHNQTSNSTISPGPNIYKAIKLWAHFSPKFLTDNQSIIL